MRLTIDAELISLWRTMSELVGFTTEQAGRVSGLSRRQLGYWEKTGFFQPELPGTGERTYSRLYSFRNLVGLKTIAILRNRHHVPLQELRKVGNWLKENHDEPWSSLSLFVAGRRVYFEEPTTGVLMDARTGRQSVFPIELVKVAADTRLEIERLQERQPSDVGRIDRRRSVAHNQRVIAGTRIPVVAVWNFHEAGYAVEEILREYPSLAEADVTSAIDFERRQRQRAG